MKFNGATFNKAQQDQLKKKVGAELDDVIKKVDEVDSRMLNYTGDWVTDNEYHENDVVTWADDGHLYEVIKAHTSSATLKPSNTEYYKAMTAREYTKITFSQTGVMSEQDKERLIEAIRTDPNAIIHGVYHGATMILRPLDDTAIYPTIGGVVMGSSTMGFVVGSVVSTAGNIRFKTYSGDTATNGTLAFESKELPLTDVVFLQ